MLNDDYKEMLQFLGEEGAEFILVGAYALAAHGYPRATMDIDIWVRPSVKNAQAVLRALQRFGAPLNELTLDDLCHDDTIFQIGVAPRRIDIITGVSGLEFDAAWSNAIDLDIEGMTVKVPCVADLIANKRSTARLKDLADVEALEKLDEK